MGSQPRGRKSEKARLVEADDIPQRLIQCLRLNWSDVVMHKKSGDLIQMVGKSVGGVDFLFILQIASDRHYELIYGRLGTVLRRSDGGERSLAVLKPETSLTVEADSCGRFEIHISALCTPEPRHRIGSHPFEIVLCNHTSLTEGNALLIAAKCESIKTEFIKTWDVPSRYSDQAWLSQMSVTADVAHLAERIRDIQEASRLNTERGTLSPMPGVCYVLGEWGGNALKFHVNRDVALLIIESFNTDMGLAAFLKQLTVQPVMHSRIRSRPSGTRPGSEVFLISPDQENGGHRVTLLETVNVLLTMRSSLDQIHEVLRVSQDSGANDEPIVTLQYFHSNAFQNVLLWVLPDKKKHHAG